MARAETQGLPGDGSGVLAAAAGVLDHDGDRHLRTGVRSEPHEPRGVAGVDALGPAVAVSASDLPIAKSRRMRSGPPSSASNGERNFPPRASVAIALAMCNGVTVMGPCPMANIRAIPRVPRAGSCPGFSSGRPDPGTPPKPNRMYQSLSSETPSR